MTDRLDIAFVWHMHQPYYRDPRSGVFELPWVRLHAIKDYLDMVEILRDHPSLHQTFNLVPSLVEQVLDYQDPTFEDSYWEHTMLPAESLTTRQRAFVVDRLCERSTHPRARAHPRYLELAQKREACLDRGIEDCAATFTPQELRDLQVWSTLAWFDPIYQTRPPLADLMARGRDFEEADKAALQSVQGEVLGRVIPAYREAMAEGRVELSTSPYYHPILPLLIDSDSARIARGDIALPSRRYAHPEDAAEQVQAAVDFHARVFGAPPAGMWCSEQAVGEAVIPFLADAGLRWTISDEGVLARSLGITIERDGAGAARDSDILYRPYLLEREGRRLAIVFRDRLLSDLIGFTYQSWDPNDAAADLLWRLREIHRSVEADPDPHLVTIALDGENAWEYYRADGHEFLAALYAGLEADPSLRCVTITEFLEETRELRSLPWLHTGSWIYADLSTWMGDTAHTAAWDLLHDTRDAVVAAGRPAEAWRHVQIAQGSDWFWWFGEHHESGEDHIWDARFRARLSEAYRTIGLAPPAALHVPILGAVEPGGERPPTARFTPQVDGRLSWPEEWDQAGSIRAPHRGTMHAGEARTIDIVRYGVDDQALYLMLVPETGVFDPDTEIAVYVAGPPAGPPTDPRSRNSRIRRRAGDGEHPDTGSALAWEFTLTVTGPATVSTTIAGVVDGEWADGHPCGTAALADVLEAAVPLDDVGLAGHGSAEIVVTARRHGRMVQVLPERGSVRLDLGPPRGAADAAGPTTDE